MQQAGIRCCCWWLISTGVPCVFEVWSLIPVTDRPTPSICSALRSVTLDGSTEAGSLSSIFLDAALLPQAAADALQQQWLSLKAQLIAAVPPPPDALASTLSEAQAKLSEALGAVGASEPVGTHFGAAALQRSVSALSDWVMSSLSWVEVSEPGALGGLSAALEELRHAAQLLASLPGRV